MPRLNFYICTGLVVGSILCAIARLPSVALPQGTFTAEEIMRLVNARPRGDASSSRLKMVLHGEHGEYRKAIVREQRKFATGYRTVYWITTPLHENGIGLFLSEDASQQGMWMYFPLPRQVVHVVSRGLPALASDFSCQDLLVEVPLSDYDFRILGNEHADGANIYRIEMKPKDERLSAELGFSYAIGWIRDDIWMITKVDYLDESGTVFKTFSASGVEKVQGVWTAGKLLMENHRARHSTEVLIDDIDYSAAFSDEAFALARFGRGFVPPSK